jgi:hypothetical protein
MIVNKDVVFMVPSGNTEMLQYCDFDWPNDTKVENENDPKMRGERPKCLVHYSIILFHFGIAYERHVISKQSEISQIYSQAMILTAEKSNRDYVIHPLHPSQNKSTGTLKRCRID